MRKDLKWLFHISFVFVTLSLVVYALHYVIFRDVYHIFFYMIMDVAFLFLNVLVVIIFIERLLAQREKLAMFQKLNMVIGAFFSEVGLDLLRRLSSSVAEAGSLLKHTDVRPDWTQKDYRLAKAAVRNFAFDVKIDPSALTDLKRFLTHKREFLLRLLENPSLLEHERFTDLLQAVFHLAEELSFRDVEPEFLPSMDYLHLMGDARRAYTQVTLEWLTYLEYLKKSYPYLFSLAVRINPLGKNPSPIVVG